MRTLAGFVAVLVVVLAACVGVVKDVPEVLRELAPPPPPRPAPGGRIMDRESMAVMFSSYNDMPNDPCGAVIDRVPFEVIAHHVVGGGLNLYWDRRTFVLEWPRSSLLLVALFEHQTPVQTYLGPWWLAGGSVIDPEGAYRPWASQVGAKWRLRIPETVFPIGLEFSLQALLDTTTSDAWRIAVR